MLFYKMSIVLPSNIDYTQSLPSLPDGVSSVNVVSTPVNLQTASPQSVVQFQLLNNGFLVPNSMYIAYTYTATTSAAGAVMKATPAVSPFSRLDELIGSNSINTIQPYGMVCSDLINFTYGVSEKYGNLSLGYKDSTSVPSIEELDSRTLTDDETGTFAFPLLGSVFANCEKLIPLFAMPQVELRLTVDSIANIFTTAVVPTGFVLSNIELRYTIINMGSAVEQLVRGMGSKIFIKSQTVSASSQTLASGSAGSLSLVYNQRFNSIKALFAHLGGTTSVNTFFDSLCTNATADFQFTVGGVNYPQRPLSATNNRYGIFQSLKQAIGSIYDAGNSQSINQVEWSYNSSSTTTATAPAKFIPAVSTRLIDSDFLLTGISSQNSPINLVINTSATSQALTVYLLIAYDAILEIDTVNRQASLKV
jgi:hypothetical protein